MKLTQTFKVLSLATVLALGADTLSIQAQDGGDRPRRNRDGNAEGGGFGGGRNMDPAERQRMMAERTKEQLEIVDDKEWQAIAPLVTKVSEARMAALAGGRGFGGRGGPGGGGPGGGGFGGAQPNPAAESLQKAIEAKASNAETKAALDKFVADRKAKQAELEKAQAALRKVLTPRQEAIATLNGLL